MKYVVLTFLIFALGGCQTLEERLAKRIGCDPHKTVVNGQVNAPAYNQYNVSCDGQKWVCRDAPFYKNCELDAGKKVK